MSISTLQNTRVQSPKKSKNLLIYVSAIVGAFVIVFFGKMGFDYLMSLNGKSGLTVDITNGRAEVFINDEKVGVTPFESKEIKPGENKITLESSGQSYETTIEFLKGSNEYIHTVGILRDLGVSDLFSSGQDVWFEKNTSGNVLRIISEPSGASVYIDNTEIGKTPFTSSKLSEGDYDIRLELTGYESQKTRVRIEDGYTSNISFKMFPMPVPSRVSTLEGSDSLYDLSTDRDSISSDPVTWLNAIIFWNQTRGINLEGIGLNRDLVFDYYIDYRGTFYNKFGEQIEDVAKFKELGDYDKGAYMGRVSDGPGLTQAARETYKVFDGSVVEETEEGNATILETGLGWLRVRNTPSTAGAEVTTVNVGEEFPVLEIQESWVKIRVNATTEGWVSRQYVQLPNAQSVQGASTTTSQTPELSDTSPTNESTVPAE